ncbi:unnamed protein product, partial [Toxocara canis]|uniref:DUF7083 domain-containing protein n=1 Tax=Toxocara canis TaxID=6265 RepID=A0A183UWR7_TOXCA
MNDHEGSFDILQSFSQPPASAASQQTGDQDEESWTRRSLTTDDRQLRSPGNTGGPGGTTASDAQGCVADGKPAAAGATGAGGADLFRYRAHCFSLSTRLPEFIYDPDNGCTLDVWFNRYEDVIIHDGSTLNEAAKARIIVSKLDA